MFPDPSLLTHPNIPKPLHGINPRTVLGQEWWDIQRRKAYATHGYCCWACGVHKSEAKYHNWLEGHEYFDFNYDTGALILKEIVALCHSCHNFIHSRRLWIMAQKGEISGEKLLDVLNHGMTLIKRNNLTPFWGTLVIYEMVVVGLSQEEALMKVFRQGSVPVNEGDNLKWEDWHMIIEGKKYYSNFESIEDWHRHYNG